MSKSHPGSLGGERGRRWAGKGPAGAERCFCTEEQATCVRFILRRVEK